MSVLAFVLPVALALAGLALWACVRAIRSGQFDDLDTPPLRALLDDVPARTDGAAPPSGGASPPRDPPPPPPAGEIALARGEEVTEP
ncbi:MAG: cbb3-type cytochrome oxidase assembly protein CcoS [Planctomycetota bacterium]|nr:MAG: cbb3-type cytochrome oxidase assembly protein CcoS [Planctomycetota bacterium]